MVCSFTGVMDEDVVRYSCGVTSLLVISSVISRLESPFSVAA